MAAHGAARTPEEEARRRGRFERCAQALSELEEIWREMRPYGPDAQEYVALRRGESPDWADLSRLADGLGEGAALLSFFTIAERALLFVWRRGRQRPAALSVELSDEARADLLRRFQNEVHRYDHTNRRGETWDRPLCPLFKQAGEHVGGVERVILAPESFGHLLLWAVVARRAGWAGEVVTLPALGMLERLRARPATRAGRALVAGNPVRTAPPLYAEQEAR